MASNVRIQKSPVGQRVTRINRLSSACKSAYEAGDKQDAQHQISKLKQIAAELEDLVTSMNRGGDID